jgi:hypothetical protein
MIDFDSPTLIIPVQCSGVGDYGYDKGQEKAWENQGWVYRPRQYWQAHGKTPAG